MTPITRRRLVLATTSVTAISAVGVYTRQWKRRVDEPRARSIYAGDAPWTDGRPASLKQFFTPVGWEIMQDPTRVQAFNLSPEAGKNDPDAWAFGYDAHRKFIATPVVPPEDRSERLRRAFLDESIYDLSHGGGGKCGGYRPHEAVRFWRGRASIAFLVCFTCRDIGVIVHDENGRVVTWQLSKAKVRGEVLAAMRAALPDDRYLDQFDPKFVPAHMRKATGLEQSTAGTQPLP